ncbi:hypothetical protein N7465_002193 [Penicillium sp. CMV-2018d]|nr:hypothetical protein N7465_002193 [Penicillium sp. CMV-2018d]
MSNNRPFLSNFLAAFRAQSTYKPTQQVSTTTSTISSAQISQSARTIATKAANSAQGASASSSASAGAHHTHHNHNHNHHNHHTHTSSPTTSATTAPTGPVQGPSPAPSHHYHHDQPSLPSTPPSSTSTPIPINHTADRQRRGSDSSSGSGGFRDAIGPEKWYIGGRTPAGEERFYRLGMVTKGGGRLGGSGRVGSIDQLSL